MSQVYIVNYSSGVDSVHATIESANERASSAKEEGKTAVKVEVQELQGGTVAVEKKKAAPKAKAPAKAKAVPKNDNDEPKAAVAKKTKPVAEQRAANAKKPAKPEDSDLPDNVKALLAGSGSVFAGKTVVVTGVPPTLGRKNAEALVTAYGGKLVKSISKNTDLVVLGNDAGPKKLEQIENYGTNTLDEDALVEMLEGSGSGTKRSADDDEDDDEEEEEEEEEMVVAKGKKQKR